jgi:hypothetical protein
MIFSSVKWKNLIGKSCFNQICYNPFVMKDFIKHYRLCEDLGVVLLIDFYSCSH